MPLESVSKRVLKFSRVMVWVILCYISVGSLIRMIIVYDHFECAALLCLYRIGASCILVEFLTIMT